MSVFMLNGMVTDRSADVARADRFAIDYVEMTGRGGASTRPRPSANRPQPLPARRRDPLTPARTKFAGVEFCFEPAQIIRSLRYLPTRGRFRPGIFGPALHQSHHERLWPKRLR